MKVLEFFEEVKVLEKRSGKAQLSDGTVLEFKAEFVPASRILDVLIPERTRFSVFLDGELYFDENDSEAITNFYDEMLEDLTERGDVVDIY